MEKDKEKIIGLYKGFITNKKMKLTSGSYYRPYQDVAYITQNQFGGGQYPVKYINIDHLDRYKIRVDDEELERLDFPHKPKGDKIFSHETTIRLQFKEHPPIILEEDIKPKRITHTRLGKIRYKGFWGKIGCGFKVIEEEYKKDITRKISFGSIVIPLNKTEYTELKNFYLEHLKVRPMELDRVKLDKRIKDYV